MKRAILIALTTGILLTGCDGPLSQTSETTAPANQKTPEELKKEAQLELLNDISGVWSDGDSLLTIHYQDNQIQFLVDDTPLLVRIGDVDPTNKTVNILITRKDNDEEEIVTLKKKDNVEKTAFTLVMTSFTASTDTFSFVRKIGTDDKNRINKIYRKAQAERDALAAQQVEEAALEQQEAAEYEDTSYTTDEEPIESEDYELDLQHEAPTDRESAL